MRKEFYLRNYFLLALVFLIFYFYSPLLSASRLNVFKEIQRNENLQEEIRKIVLIAIKKTYGEKVELPKNLSPFFKKRIPIFITAKKGDEIRGCMGSLKPQKSSLKEEIITNVSLAFTRDLRHKPIQKSELNGMEIYLTAIGNIRLIKSLDSISPIEDAVLIRSKNKEAVVLPGEAKTQRYLIAFLKAKAGIKQKEPFQLYKVETTTLKAYP